MSRSINDCNEKIFNKIYEFILSSSDYGVDTSFKRRIEAAVSDRDFLKNAKILDTCIIAFNVFFVKVLCNHGLYVMSIGLDLRHAAHDMFSEVDLNAGFVSLILGETNTCPLPSSRYEEMIDNLLYPGGSGEDVVYVNFKKILPYFPKIQAFSCDETIDFEVNLENISILLLLRNPQNLHLGLSKELLTCIEAAVSSFDNVFPVKQILYAITSSKWEHAFLEMYRCIEFFYDDFIMHKIYAKLGHDVSYSIFKGFYSALPIPRAREENIIQFMFEALDAYSQDLSNYHAAFINNNVNKRSAAKWVYTLRNCIVHSRKELVKQLPPNIDWNMVLKGLVQIVLGLNKISKPFIAQSEC